MATLYRKYRPLKFADVEAQEPIVTTLQNEVADNKLAHAYIFAGPRGVGKTTLARLLAKAIICDNRKAGESEPCNSCPTCTDVNAGRHIDIIEIDAASHTGVDNVRENIIDNARFQPTRAKYKIFIIDEVHMLSTSAFNALLKTLEEPPEHVIFILATTELYKLPATVVSRCQRFQFKKIPHDALVAKLKKICSAEEIKVDSAVLERVAHASDGALRDAESILGQLFSLNLKKITLDDVTLILPTVDASTILNLIEATLKNDSATALKELDLLAENGVEANHLLDDLIEILRLTLVYQATKKTDDLEATYDSATVKRIKALVADPDLSSAKLVAAIENAFLRREQIRITPYPYLPIELWIISGLNQNHHASDAIVSATPVRVTRKTESAPLPASKAAVATTTSTPATPTPKTPDDKPGFIEATIKSAISTITGHSSNYETPKTTLAEVQKQWPDLVQKISSQNHALTFILSMAEIKSIGDDGLHLSVPYSLHRDKLIELKNRQIIESCLFAAFKEKIHFHCDITEKTPEPVVAPEILNAALEFGGEVVG